MVILVVPVDGSNRQVDPWNLLVSQPNLNRAIGPSEGSVFKYKADSSGRTPKTDL